MEKYNYYKICLHEITHNQILVRIKQTDDETLSVDEILNEMDSNGDLPYEKFVFTESEPYGIDICEIPSNGINEGHIPIFELDKQLSDGTEEFILNQI